MFDFEEIEEVFTALARELKNAKGKTLEELLREKEKQDRLKAKMLEEQVSEDANVSPQQDPFRGYDPTVTDFLQRCRTEEEGIEIVTFLIKQKELDEQEGRAIIEQIREKGIRSFGEYRRSGYYDKQARRKQFPRTHKIRKKDSEHELLG